MRKRFSIVPRSGADTHGGDFTGTACRAARCAASHSSLCGVTEALHGPGKGGEA